MSEEKRKDRIFFDISFEEITATRELGRANISVKDWKKFLDQIIDCGAISRDELLEWIRERRVK